MPLIRTHLVPHPPLIIPAIGRGREADIQSTIDAYQRVSDAVAADRPDLIIFITPHGAVYEDYLHISPGAKAEGDFSAYGAPEVKLRMTYDETFIKHVTIIAEQMGIPAGTLGGNKKKELDHGVMIPQYFIRKKHTGYKTMRVSISGLSMATHYQFGQCIAEALKGINRRAVIIASGDLSHKLTQDGPYGYAPEGPEFDRQLCEAMSQSDFLRILSMDGAFTERAAECGLRSLIIMAGTLDGQNVKADFQSYEGPFGVGYAVCSFTPGEENEARHLLPAYQQACEERMKTYRQNEDAYVRLARESLENFVHTGRLSELPEKLPEEMLNARAGTFVSIKKNGRLRGCIGTTEAYRTHIAEEIVGNAISAGTRDPRFDAVTADELPQLVYSVDVLSSAEPVAGLSELDAAQYGVIVENGTERGLLLPRLEGVDTVEQQISIALQKAGISPSEPYQISRFKVERHT